MPCLISTSIQQSLPDAFPYSATQPTGSVTATRRPYPVGRGRNPRGDDDRLPEPYPQTLAPMVVLQTPLQQDRFAIGGAKGPDHSRCRRLPEEGARPRRPVIRRERRSSAFS